MSEMVFGVSQLNEYLSKKLLNDPFLGSVSVVGEVTNFSMSSIGHAFFSLKDEGGMIGCIVYDFFKSSVTDVIDDGALVKVVGKVMYYKKSGSIQIAVQSAKMQGVGDLYARSEQTKKKLYQEGLFDARYKKALPEFPLRIGVVTSAAGAALHDIINVATRRFEGISIFVYPAQVQGQGASKQICRGIQYFNDTDSVDVIIAGRGGGSFEDLFAFNEECVARAVFNSQIPIVSAVGHETDYSLADMAADLRAPTPSAAAELVVKDKGAVIEYLNETKRKLAQSLRSVLEQSESRMNVTAAGIRSFPFNIKIEQTRSKIDALSDAINKSIAAKIEKNTFILDKHLNALENLNPKNVLQRGFAIVYDAQNNVVTTMAASKKHMDIEFRDGRVAVVRKDGHDG